MSGWPLYALVAWWSLTGVAMSWAAGETLAIERLAEPVQACIERKDTAHPLFHGCIDWHSAVHAHWALLYSANKLGQSPKWLERLNTMGVEQELGMLRQSDRLGAFFELPYGRAWFLQLARDAEQLWKDNRLHQAGDIIYASLLSFARAGGGDISSSAYDNASWYLYQLARWAKFTAKVQDLHEIRQLALGRIKTVSHWPDFYHIRGFFAPKALALLLAQELAGKEEITLLEGAILREGLSPLHFPLQAAHQGGLNYSRAWGLWALYQATGKDRYKQAFTAHLNIMMEQRAQWINDYRRYGHWVAQFGLFAHRLADELP